MAETQIARQSLPQAETLQPGTPAPSATKRQRQPRLTMNADLAELVGEASERGVPPEAALQRLGFGKKAAKRAMKHELLRMVLLRKIEEAGGTQEVAAQVIVDALKAEYVEVAKHEGKIEDEKAYADHPTRLQAFDRLMDLQGLTGGRAKQQGANDERPILNVQAGAKVQLVFFGEARDATPD